GGSAVTAVALVDGDNTLVTVGTDRILRVLDVRTGGRGVVVSGSNGFGGWHGSGSSDSLSPPGSKSPPRLGARTLAAAGASGGFAESEFRPGTASASFRLGTAAARSRPGTAGRSRPGTAAAAAAAAAAATAMPEPCLPVLRAVRGAHDADITALAVSRRLGLVATSSPDLTVRVWDYATLTLASVCVGHRHEPTVLCFCEPLPLLAAADGSGLVLVWGMPP
ncbi:unnamed protein product, partial [Phaeothamnion confervicola]